jgi:hypothetical protein
MILVLMISLAAFVLYMACVILFFGVLPSISESYYRLEKRGRCGYVFTVWCALIAVSVMAMMFECSEGRWFQFLGLFAGGGLAFVGTAPLFKGHERVIHYVSAGVCAVASVAWMGLMGVWYVPAVFPVVGGLVSLRFGNPVFWVETGIFLSVYLALGILHGG